MNNHISISKNNGTIIVLAKYFGPNLSDHQIFDFSVNLDALDEPFFTIGNGKKLDCCEILDFIKKRVKKEKPIAIKVQEQNKKKSEDINKKANLESQIYEKLTNKNAVWNGSETKAYHNWKAKVKNKYRTETGKISHYRGTPTKQFSEYLKSMLNAKAPRKQEPKRVQSPKKVIEKKPSTPKVEKKDLSEQYVFNSVTGKKAIWNGSETKNFINWKNRIHKNYKKDTGKNPYYKNNTTVNYRNYLQKSFKIK
jgi:hypothetical protein